MAATEHLNIPTYEQFAQLLTHMGVIADSMDIIEDAQEMSYTAEAWAVGTKNGIDVGSSDPQYHNNAKYYKEQAASSASSASTYASNASSSASAAATQADNAADSATAAAGSASEASGHASSAAGYASSASAQATEAANQRRDSEAWAVGKKDGIDVPSSESQYHNNSKYWAEQAATSAAILEEFAYYDPEDESIVFRSNEFVSYDVADESINISI